MITATYVSATTFTVSGDQTAEFHVGRRVKHIGDTTGYGTIESVSIPVSDTQVVLTAASDDLDASLSGVFFGIVSSYESKASIPIHTHDGDEGSGGNIFASPTFTGQATIPTIDLTGGQIAFPATAVPSADPNTLDDYEEGEYEVAVTCSTSGSYVMSTNKTLAYTKIGREVFIQGKCDITSESSPVGTVQISLPFTPADLTETSGRSYPYMSLFNHGGNIPNGVMLSINEGVTVAAINAIQDDGTVINITEASLDTAWTFGCSFNFIIA